VINQMISLFSSGHGASWHPPQEHGEAQLDRRRHDDDPGGGSRLRTHTHLGRGRLNERTDLGEAGAACTSELQKPVGRTGYAKVADERTLSGMSTRQEVEHQEQQATCSRCAYYLPQLAPRVPHHPT
jgi:hypothetical protein